jgi:hypothetical protein
VPQNVLYSVRDWAWRAGLLSLTPDHVVRGEDVDVVKRFLQDAGVKPYVREVLDERSARLRANIAPRRLQTLLRELGYMVELEE